MNVKITFLIISALWRSSCLFAQTLLPEECKLNKDTTIVMDGYTYQSDAFRGVSITLYNKENQWTNARNVFKDTGETYLHDGTERTNNIIDNPKMESKLFSIIDNAFPREMADEFGKEQLHITIFLDSTTGKVQEVEFGFSSFWPYTRIPISIYRDIELKLKKQISFVTTDVGKRLNYIILTWLQRPTGILPPIIPDWLSKELNKISVDG